MNLPTASLQLFVGLFVYILTWPLLITWRLSLYLLLPFPVYEPALSYYQKCHANLYIQLIVKPVAKRLVTMVCAILILLLSILLALALFEKSLAYFVPWISTHFQRMQYKQEHEETWHSELALGLAGFALSCVPFCSVLGVAVGMLFYTRRASVYERLGNKLVAAEQLETRESSVTDVEDQGVERFTVEEQDLGGSSVSAPPPVVISTQRATAVRFERNPYTLAGVVSIWGSRNGRLASGYDGRSIQRSNSQEDMEMAESVGKRE